MTVKKQCPMCNKEYGIEVPYKVIKEWVAGECIQYAWPYGSATDRESLISGLCPDCQDKVFNEEDS